MVGARRITSFVVVLSVVVVGCTGGRSVEAYCGEVDTINAELREIAGGATGFAALAAAFEALGVLHTGLTNLAEVSPEEINTDVEMARDVLGEQLAALNEAAGNPIAAVVGSLASSLVYARTFERVDEFTLSNCGVTLLGAIPAPAPTTTVPVLTGEQEANAIEQWCSEAGSELASNPNEDVAGLARSLRTIASLEGTEPGLAAASGRIATNIEASLTVHGEGWSLPEILAASEGGYAAYEEDAALVTTALGSTCGIQSMQIWGWDAFSDLLGSASPRLLESGPIEVLTSSLYFRPACETGNPYQTGEARAPRPSTRDGILVFACRTTSGAAAYGIDLATRLPVWAYELPIGAQLHSWDHAGGTLAIAFSLFHEASGLDAARTDWHVVALDPVSGSPLWEQAFSDLDQDPERADEYIGVTGVTRDGATVLIGKTELETTNEALNLDPFDWRDLPVKVLDRQGAVVFEEEGYVAGDIVNGRYLDFAFTEDTRDFVAARLIDTATWTQLDLFGDLLDSARPISGFCSDIVAVPNGEELILARPETGATLLVPSADRPRYAGAGPDGALVYLLFSDTYAYYTDRSGQWEQLWTIDGSAIDEVFFSWGMLFMQNTAGEIFRVGLDTGVEQGTVPRFPFDLGSEWEIDYSSSPVIVAPSSWEDVACSGLISP